MSLLEYLSGKEAEELIETVAEIIRDAGSADEAAVEVVKFLDEVKG